MAVNFAFTSTTVLVQVSEQGRWHVVTIVPTSNLTKHFCKPIQNLLVAILNSVNVASRVSFSFTRWSVFPPTTRQVKKHSCARHWAAEPVEVRAVYTRNDASRERCRRCIGYPGQPGGAGSTGTGMRCRSIPATRNTTSTIRTRLGGRPLIIVLVTCTKL